VYTPYTFTQDLEGIGLTSDTLGACGEGVDHLFRVRAIQQQNGTGSWGGSTQFSKYLKTALGITVQVRADHSYVEFMVSY
jgi:hypothetical protein